MRTSALLTFALLGATMARPAPLPAQTVCRPADSLGSRFLAHVARHSAPSNATDATVRDSLHLGAVSSRTEVVIVTQESVCKKARDAYQASLGGAGGSPFSGRVYVVKSGTTYAVLDPDFHYQNRTDNWIIMVMDARYRKLSLF